MNDLIAYLKRPVACENKQPQLGDFIILLAIYTMALIPCAVIAVITCKILNVRHEEISLTPWMKLFVGIILAPVYEEIIFRSLLKFKKINVILFSVTLLLLIGYYIIRSRTEAALFFSILLLGFFSLVIFFRRTQIEAFISSKFKYFFYATILIFGLLHAFNFTGDTYTLLAFSFLLGSPQLVLGSILGYIRMTYGLVYSILFHMIINLSIILSVLGSL